jgi:NadR type nicotinamide-nucleotide adenylyltransferase
VVITGSECTGKTTLARELAEHYRTIWVPEYARTYVERASGPLTAADVEPIARGQMAAQEEALDEARSWGIAGPSLLIFDTDLISTALYARHYYGDCPAWIEEVGRARMGDLYLLLHPDVPWVADGNARDRGHMREHMHGLFRAALTACGARTVDVRGAWDGRRASARRAIDALVR